MGGIICTFSGALALLGSVLLALFQSRLNVDEKVFSWQFTLPVVGVFAFALFLQFIGIFMLLNEREKARTAAIERDAEVRAIRATQDEIKTMMRRQYMVSSRWEFGETLSPKDISPKDIVAKSYARIVISGAVLFAIYVAAFVPTTFQVPGTQVQVPVAAVAALALAGMACIATLRWARRVRHGTRLLEAIRAKSAPR